MAMDLRPARPREATGTDSLTSLCDCLCTLLDGPGGESINKENLFGFYQHGDFQEQLIPRRWRWLHVEDHDLVR